MLFQEKSPIFFELLDQDYIIKPDKNMHTNTSIFRYWKMYYRIDVKNFCSTISMLLHVNVDAC